MIGFDPILKPASVSVMNPVKVEPNPPEDHQNSLPPSRKKDRIFKAPDRKEDKLDMKP